MVLRVVNLTTTLFMCLNMYVTTTTSHACIHWSSELVIGFYSAMNTFALNFLLEAAVILIFSATCYLDYILCGLRVGSGCQLKRALTNNVTHFTIITVWWLMYSAMNKRPLTSELMCSCVGGKLLSTDMPKAKYANMACQHRSLAVNDLGIVSLLVYNCIEQAKHTFVV